MRNSSTGPTSDLSVWCWSSVNTDKQQTPMWDYTDQIYVIY